MLICFWSAPAVLDLIFKFSCIKSTSETQLWCKDYSLTLWNSKEWYFLSLQNHAVFKSQECTAILTVASHNFLLSLLSSPQKLFDAPLHFFSLHFTAGITGARSEVYIGVYPVIFCLYLWSAAILVFHCALQNIPNLLVFESKCKPRTPS